MRRRSLRVYNGEEDRQEPNRLVEMEEERCKRKDKGSLKLILKSMVQVATNIKEQGTRNLIENNNFDIMTMQYTNVAKGGRKLRGKNVEEVKKELKHPEGIMGYSDVTIKDKFDTRISKNINNKGYKRTKEQGSESVTKSDGVEESGVYQQEKNKQIEKDQTNVEERVNKKKVVYIKVDSQYLTIPQFVRWKAKKLGTRPVEEWEKERKMKSDLKKETKTESKVSGNTKDYGNNTKGTLDSKKSGRRGEAEEKRKKENRRDWGIIMEKIIEQWRSGKDARYNKCFNVDIRGRGFVYGTNVAGGKMTGKKAAIEWRRVQKDYAIWSGIRRTGERWLEEIRKKWRNIAWDRWQYKNDVL